VGCNIPKHLHKMPRITTMVSDGVMQSRDDDSNFQDLVKLMGDQMASVSSLLLQLHEQHQKEVHRIVEQHEKQALKSARKLKKTRKGSSVRVEQEDVVSEQNCAQRKKHVKIAPFGQRSFSSCNSGSIFAALSDKSAAHISSANSLCEHHVQTIGSSSSNAKSSRATLLPYWQNDGRQSCPMDALPVVTCMMEDMVMCKRWFHSKQSMDVPPGEAPNKFAWMVRFMMPPGCRKGMLWELFGSLLIMYDMIFIPMQSFNLQRQDRVLNTIAKLICVYWTLDIPRHFFLMYEQMGVVESRPEQVVRHYLRTWFVPDVMVVVFDWIEWIAGFGGSASRSWRFNSKIARAFRVLRVVRLVRVVKAWKTLHELVDYVQSPLTLFLYKVACLIAVVVFCVHYSACYSFALTDWMTPTESWIHQSGILVSDGWDQYTSALHWSLAQAGFSSTDVHPATALDRGLAAIIGVGWLFLCGYVCSQLTLWTFQLRDSNLEIEQHEARMRKFMHQRSVHGELSNQVVRFFRLNYRKLGVRVMEKDIKHFKDLPVDMRIHLHKDIYRKQLTKSPVFTLFDSIVLNSLCHVAMDEQHHLAEDQIFAEGEDAVRVLHLESGTMKYYFGGLDDALEIRKSSWIAEIALWCMWKHQGGLIAVTSCTTVNLNIERFLAVIAVSVNKGANVHPARYFAQAVRLKLEDMENPHDLCFDMKWLQIMSDFARKSCPSPFCQPVAHSPSWYGYVRNSVNRIMHHASKTVNLQRTTISFRTNI